MEEVAKGAGAGISVEGLAGWASGALDVGLRTLGLHNAWRLLTPQVLLLCAKKTKNPKPGPEPQRSKRCPQP